LYLQKLLHQVVVIHYKVVAVKFWELQEHNETGRPQTSSKTFNMLLINRA